MLEDLRHYKRSYGATKKGGLRTYTYVSYRFIYMHVNVVIFGKPHGDVKNIHPRQSRCNQNSTRLLSQPMDIEHSSRYVRQELTLPIASTENKSITFRRLAC